MAEVSIAANLLRVRGIFPLAIAMLAFSAHRAEAQVFMYCSAGNWSGTYWLSDVFQSDAGIYKVSTAFAEFVERTYDVSDVSADCPVSSSRAAAESDLGKPRDFRYKYVKTGWIYGREVPSRVSTSQTEASRRATSTNQTARPASTTLTELTVERRKAMELAVREKIRLNNVAIQKQLDVRMAEIKRRRAACKAGDKDACRVDMRKSGASKQ